MAELPDAPWAKKELPDAPWAAALKSSAVGDFFKSIPRGIMGGMSAAGSALGQATAHEMSQPDMAAEIPSAHDTTGILERNVTGPMHQPEGRAGKFGAAIGESIGNPTSYVGPGSLPLKIGGAALSAIGGEGAGQATEGTKAETPARLIGALMGGVTAAKTLGPTQAKAAVPGGQELKDIAVKGGQYGGYEGTRNSGLALDPKGVGSWASGIEQQLIGDGFTGGKYGTAPKTMDVLGTLQKSPPGTAPISSSTAMAVPGTVPPSASPTVSISASNLDTLRKALGKIAQETQPGMGGAIKPTADAAAASKALQHLRDYTENIPAGHVLAGDAASYASAIKEANANYAAGSRALDFDTRLTKAERATDRQVAGSLDSQIKSKAGQLLDSAASRGMNEAEKAQLELINSGSATSNILRQLGRGGAGVIPMGAHIGTAAATGGASIPASLAIGIPLYGARKIAEAMTKSRAHELVDMLAKRSPEYESRAAAIPQVDNMPNKAAILRAMIGGGNAAQ